LENQSLLKRCAYLKGENDSLKDDIRELNLGNFHTLDASSRQLRNSQAKVSEHDSIIESQKKEIASLKLQVADVEMKLQGKNLEANDQPQTKNDTHLSQLEELNQKIQQLEEINKQIVVQRDTLDAMLFESSSKIKKLETTVTDQEKIISTHSQVDSQRIETNQETELKEVSKSDAICEQQQKVIESLT
jgi:chromosome segregation ATPase